MNEAEIYQRGLDEYGASPQSLHWVDYRSMAIRFKNLVKDLDLEGRTILDAGCGMGDILPYLYTRANHFDYLGIDINAGFIEIARQRYEGHRFEIGNPFDGKFNRKSDVVICSGVMNINVKNWQRHRLVMIKNLFDLSRECLAFNMAGGFAPARADSLIAYADAGKILDFCKKLSPKLSIKTDYLSQDFTVVMYR